MIVRRFAPLHFTVMVREDSERTLKGKLQARLDQEGLRLRQPDGKEVLVPVGTRAIHLGGNRLRIDLGTRQLELDLVRWNVYQQRLARDLAAFLRGEREALDAADYRLPWVVYVPVALAAGIPMLTLGGAIWGALGAGLAGACLAIGRKEEWSLAVRQTVAYTLTLAGYACVLLVVFPGLLPTFQDQGTKTNPRVSEEQPWQPGGRPAQGDVRPDMERIFAELERTRAELVRMSDQVNELQRREQGAREEAERALAAEKRAREREQGLNRQIGEARREARKAGEDSEALAYLHRIGLAERAWQRNDVGRVEQLLAECPENLRRWEWHYLRRLCRPERRTLTGHMGNVTCVAFSPDGQRLASYGHDETLRLWDSRTGKQVLAARLGVGFINDLAFTPDGKHLVTPGHREVRVWDATTGQVVRTFPEQPCSLTCVALSPDGKQIASATSPTTVMRASDGKVTANLPGEVRLWDVMGKEIATLRKSPDSIRRLCFSPDGNRLAGGATDGSLWVWDLEKRQEIQRLRGRTGPLNAIAYSPDGKFLVSGSGTFRGRAGEIKVRDARTGAEVRLLQGTTGNVRSLAFTADGKRLVAGGEDQVVRVWDMETGRHLHQYRGHTRPITSVAFSPDGRQLASASESPQGGKGGEIRLWDQHVGSQEGRTLAQLAGGINHLAVSPDGKHLALSQWSGVVHVLEAASGKEGLVLRGHGREVAATAFRSDGKALVTAGGDGWLKVWNLANGKVTYSVRAGGRLTDVAFKPESTTIAATRIAERFSGGLVLWDFKTNQLQVNPWRDDDVLDCLAYTSSGGTLARVDANGDLRVRNLFRADTPVKIHDGHVKALVYSPDDRWLASAGRDGTAKLQKMSSETAQFILRGHSGPVTSVAFTPDAARLATGSEDGTVKLWDTTTGQEVVSFGPHAAPVIGVAFSPDGQCLYCATSSPGEPSKGEVIVRRGSIEGK